MSRATVNRVELSASSAVLGQERAGASDRPSRAGAGANEHRSFRLALELTNWLVLASIAALAWTAIREYSTYRYVDAFSDAIVPVSGSPEQKIQAILDWMAHPPTRISEGVAGTPHDRDPIDTLNYQALLNVCGTATNAFLNLADTSDLRARRLLLLDANRSTKHVDAEVFVDGRWIVVDPTFRVILRGADGRMLTRSELADPVVFSAATRNIPRYDPSYTFESTVHIRLAGIPFVGRPVRRALNAVLPGWDNSAAISLVMERSELGDLILAALVVVFLLGLLFSLRWYGTRRLHIELTPLRERFGRAYRAFFDPAS